MFQSAPTGFIPQQDQGRLIANIQLPDSASLERTQEAVVAKIDEDRPRHAGRRPHGRLRGQCRSCCRPTVPISPRCSSSSIPSTSGRSPELRDAAIMAQPAEGLGRAGQGGPGHGARGVGDPGPGHRRRLQVHRRGPRRPRPGRLAAADRRPGPKTAEGARPEPGDDPVPLQDAAVLPRHRPRQGRIAGRVAGRRESDAGHVHGLALRQQFQRFRPPLAGHGPGRRDAIATAWKTSTCSRSATGWGRWCSLGTLVHPREIAGPIAVPRYNLYTAASVSGNIDTGYSTGEAIKTIEQIGRRNLAAFHEGRLDRADVHAEAGGRHVDLRLLPGHRQRVPGPVGALRELVAAAGGDPGRALVPALLRGRRPASRGGTSTSSCRSAWSCWSGWRARTRSSSSSTPSSCTARAARRSRPPRKPRGCGCGRS